MSATAIKRSVAVVALGLGVGVVGMGGASAANATTRVVSDRIAYSGTFGPGPNPGTFVLTSTSCTLTSDGETTKFPCQLTANVTTSSTGSLTGNATVSSSDGMTQWTFTLTPVTGTASFKMVGKGKETDTADPGQPPPKPYPCVVTGKVTPNMAAGTATGTATVSESSTAP